MEKINLRIKMRSNIAINSYLRQQQLLFGSELYISKRDTKDSGESISYNKLVSEEDLEKYRISICLCKECGLGETRNNFVFGVGDPNAELMLVGEAPGKEEDLKGEPFVGRAGKLLDNILKAINKKRGDGVYIANVLKCRPPNNRDPLPSEVKKCEPYLLKQLSIVNPKLKSRQISYFRNIKKVEALTDKFKNSRDKTIKQIKKLKWKNGFYRSDIGHKVINK